MIKRFRSLTLALSRRSIRIIVSPRPLAYTWMCNRCPSWHGRSQAKSYRLRRQRDTDFTTHIGQSAAAYEGEQRVNCQHLHAIPPQPLFLKFLRALGHVALLYRQLFRPNRQVASTATRILGKRRLARTGRFCEGTRGTRIVLAPLLPKNHGLVSADDRAPTAHASSVQGAAASHVLLLLHAPFDYQINSGTTTSQDSRNARSCCVGVPSCRSQPTTAWTRAWHRSDGGR